MTAGDLELVDVLVWWAVIGPMAFTVVRLDERRLHGVRLARAWPPVSRDAAIVTIWMLGFQPVALLAFYLVHFGRTRWSARGLTLGLAWTLYTVAAGFGVMAVVESALERFGLLDS